MKHPKLFMLLFLTVVPGLLPAEIKKPVYSQDRTVSNHTLSLNLVGLSYAYEQALGPRSTILFSVATAYSYGKMLGIELDRNYGLNLTTRDYHLVRGAIGVEPRFYYNLLKRHRNKKRTFGNSGGYLSVEAAYSFPIAVSGGIRFVNLYSVTPYWGFRRVWRHFIFDLAGGVGYISSSDHTNALTGCLRLGLGYKF